MAYLYKVDYNQEKVNDDNMMFLYVACIEEALGRENGSSMGLATPLAVQ